MHVAAKIGEFPSMLKAMRTKSTTLSPRVSLLELHPVFPSDFVQLFPR
jgi:hypothetical protein